MNTKRNRIVWSLAACSIVALVVWISLSARSDSWNVSDGRVVAVQGLAFDSAEDTLLCFGRDGTLTVRDASDGALQRSIAGSGSVLQFCGNLSTERDIVFALQKFTDGIPRLCLYNTKSLRRVCSVRSDASQFTCVAQSPAGKVFAATGQGAIHEFQPDLSGGASVITASGAIRSLAVSDDGQLLAMAGDSCHVVNLSDLSPAWELPEEAFAVTFSPDSSRLAIVLGQRRIRIVRTVDWSTECELRGVPPISFSPDSSTLACGRQERMPRLVRLWDRIERWAGHGSYGVGVVWDRRELVLWNIVNRSDILIATADVTALAFSPSGTKVAVGKHDGSVEMHVLP